MSNHNDQCVCGDCAVRRAQSVHTSQLGTAPSPSPENLADRMMQVVSTELPIGTEGHTVVRDELIEVLKLYA